MESLCSRRQMMGYIFAGSALVLAGCSSDNAAASDVPAADGVAAKPAMLVYRDPQCGCCGKWAEQAAAAGYPVTMEMRADMSAVKAKLGVPSDLASCHTVTVAGYVLEGHVPFDHVAMLLTEKPKDIIGLAVPGMPRGSPGMQMPDGSVDAFDVVGFARSGMTRLYTL